MRKTLYMDSFIYLIVLRKHKSLSYTTKYKNVNDDVYDDITRWHHLRCYFILQGIYDSKRRLKIDKKCDDTANFTGIKSQHGVCEVKHGCEGYNVACWQKKMKT